MRSLIVTIVLTLLRTAGINAESEGLRAGDGNLRDNPQVTIYHETKAGRAKFVQGNLTEPVPSGRESDALFRFLETYRGAFKMKSPSSELRVRRVDSDKLGMKHLRLSQEYEGLPVIGGDMVAHFTPDGRLRTVNGTLHEGIEIDISPVVSAAAARQAALGDLTGFFGPGTPDQPQLVVFPWEGSVYLCWHLYIFSNTPMGRWEYFIDARNGEIVFKANRIMSENDVGTGVGVMGGSRNHIDTHFDDRLYRMIDRTRRASNDPHLHGGQMPDGSDLRTFIAGATLPGNIAVDPNNVWDDSLQAPAVDGHVYSALVYDWLLSSVGRNSYNDLGASMLTSVNYYAEGTNNAYWNGERIVVWGWSTNWRSLAGCPDVIAHEWGHAVTEYTSSLVYQKEPGALNESFSDMMGAAFEFAHDSMDNPDWLMGENGLLLGGGFRSMSDPHLFGDPSTYGPTDPYWMDVENCTPDRSNDYCGVHSNSGVGNKWFYLLSDGGTHNDVTVTGIGVENAFQIAYRANAYYWNTLTDYHEGALATVSAAQDLDPTGVWAATVATAWEAVGVAMPGPFLVISYPGEVPSVMTPDQPATFEVVIAGLLGGEVIPGSACLNYSIDGAAYTAAPLAQVSEDNYEATLPASSCFNRLKYYVSAKDSTSGTFTEPSPTDPYAAVVATDSFPVYDDDFEIDRGWTVSGSVADGAWERGIPAGLGRRSDPPTDYDGSGQCWLTDNVSGNSDIDGGTTVLTSPRINLSIGDARVSYARWFSNSRGDNPYEDVMEVLISNDNGASWITAEIVGPKEQADGGWLEHSFFVGDFVTPTPDVRLRFEASDLGGGSLVEAAVDAVRLTYYDCDDGSLAVTTWSLPDWTQGVEYMQQLETRNAVGQVTWSDVDGDLAGTGLSLSVDGLVSGTLSAPGIFEFTAEATDEGSGSHEMPLSILVNVPVEVDTLTIHDWTAGGAFGIQQLAAAGGTGAYTWSDMNDDLAIVGLILDSVTGEISGVPATDGPVTFTAVATDEVGGTGQRTFAFTINPELTITTDSIPEGHIGREYSTQLAATGGTSTHTWFDLNGDLDGTGLALAGDGSLSGIPTVDGQIEFTAAVADSHGGYDERPLSLTVAAGCCVGMTGNVDCDPSDVIDIGDVTSLTAHLFITLEALCCEEEAESDGVSGIDIGDLTRLIDHLFISLEPLPSCL